MAPQKCITQSWEGVLFLLLFFFLKK